MMKLIDSNYLHLITMMMGLLIVITFNCVSGLPLNGHSELVAPASSSSSSASDPSPGQSNLADPYNLGSGSGLENSLQSALDLQSTYGGLVNIGNPFDSYRQWIELKSLLNDLERQQQRPANSPLNRKSWKRSCTIDAGMTYNCDFRQLLSAVNARKYLESPMTPGRRKRPYPYTISQSR